MTDANETRPVTWSHDARGVMTVMLNRPERNNAYNGNLIGGLHDALDAGGAIDGLRAVVVRGEGRHFQAGADLDWLMGVRASDAAGNLAASRATAMAVDRFNRLAVPTFAVVQGACVGGGTGLLAACDVVIAAETAKFAISEVRWGLTAAIIVPQLVDAIGVRHMRRFALTGEMFDAATALRIGLVHEICAADQLDSKLDEILDVTLKNAPDAIAETKSLTFECADGALNPAALDRLIDVHSFKRQSDEAGEGIASFQEKRPARWTPDV
ncbi:MAG: enoyl-CoA hydratase-related protein, partial [Pseudomonadota bacterium]